MAQDAPSRNGYWSRITRRGFVFGGLAIGGVLAIVGSLIVEAPGTAAAQGRPGQDAITATRFSLTIDGNEIATFNELSGIIAEVGVSEYWASDGNNVSVNKLPAKAVPPTVVLRRGLNGSIDLWAWHETVRTGQMSTARKSASLTMFNAEGKPVAKYWLEKAWPTKIEVGGLEAGASSAMVETVTLTAEYIQRVAP